MPSNPMQGGKPKIQPNNHIQFKVCVLMIPAQIYMVQEQ